LLSVFLLYNEKSGILDEADECEVDLASYAWQIWKNATDADKSLLKTIPELANSVYGTKSFCRGEACLAPTDHRTKIIDSDRLCRL